MNEVEDEKKPFAVGTQEDDFLPDPDETLMLNQGHGKVWMVKVIHANLNSRERYILLQPRFPNSYWSAGSL